LHEWNGLLENMRAVLDRRGLTSTDACAGRPALGIHGLSAPAVVRERDGAACMLAPLRLRAAWDCYGHHKSNRNRGGRRVGGARLVFTGNGRHNKARRHA